MLNYLQAARIKALNKRMVCLLQPCHIYFGEKTEAQCLKATTLPSVSSRLVRNRLLAFIVWQKHFFNNPLSFRKNIPFLFTLQFRV